MLLTMTFAFLRHTAVDCRRADRRYQNLYVQRHEMKCDVQRRRFGQRDGRQVSVRQRTRRRHAESTERVAFQLKLTHADHKRRDS